VKLTTESLRASHVNSGTAVPRDELPWPKASGPVIRAPKLQLSIDKRSVVTNHGGLALFLGFVRQFGVAQEIDASVSVLKKHMPYHESDHVLAQAATLFIGGTCIEDMATLQNSDAALRMFGACRLPDPTTGGDLLRRFDRREHPEALPGLRHAVDTVQGKVWRKLARRGRRKKRERLAIVDIDGHTKRLYGVQKEGADFSHRGEWSYYPLVLTLSSVGEWLAVRNRPGCHRQAQGTAELLDVVLPRVTEHFGETLVRADSEFDQTDIREACRKHGAHFAFVGRTFADRPGIAASIPEKRWTAFTPRAQRRAQSLAKQRGYRPRRKKRDQRRRRARARHYKELHLAKQWIAEVPWTPPGANETYRLVIRRQLIEHRKGQMFLCADYRYRYVVTDLPRSYSTQDVVDETYQRCDQENLIEQMGSGIAMWRMPVAEFDGNCAWLEIARLAWNIGKWIAQLALPGEVVRWEWKRYRCAFVDAPAAVTKGGRRINVRLAGSHRFCGSLIDAHQRLQT